MGGRRAKLAFCSVIGKLARDFVRYCPFGLEAAVHGDCFRPKADDRNRLFSVKSRRSTLRHPGRVLCTKTNPIIGRGAELRLLLDPGQRKDDLPGHFRIVSLSRP